MQVSEPYISKCHTHCSYLWVLWIMYYRYFVSGFSMGQTTYVLHTHTHTHTCMRMCVCIHLHRPTCIYLHRNILSIYYCPISCWKYTVYAMWLYKKINLRGLLNTVLKDAEPLCCWVSQGSAQSPWGWDDIWETFRGHCHGAAATEVFLSESLDTVCLSDPSVVDP